ncbi:lipase [Nocardioides sp. W3-2-3]|uniref:alpha/beta fold hydrolase n=1 Tax=Nocardioides convexus TaxID=2712224 RepID=UPI0024185D53|nr:alpha/beta fold hydrolase [Nocardioides convexus]NHA01949.1 lipase [Nocardioides convexus]
MKRATGPRRTRWITRLLGVSLVAVGLAAPVVASAPAQAAAPTSGWNDWSCRPSAAHPQPVVLLHGLGGQAVTNWFYHGTRLADAGYCVFSTTYGQGAFGDLVGGLGSMRASAVQVGAFVDKVRAATGAAEVDLVGHSEGSTVSAYYLKHEGGAAKVKDYVGFGTNYQGSTLNGLSVLIKAAMPFLPSVTEFVQSQCASCLEFLAPNDFLDDLQRGGVAVPGVAYTNIMSRYDTVVTPYTSGRIDQPGVTNIVLQDRCAFDFSGHLAMAVDPNVNLLIRRALDPEDPPAMRCSLSLPAPF